MRMQHRSTIAVLVASASLTAACGQTTVIEVAPTDSREGAPEECLVRGPAPAGAPLRCASDSDCGGGARCDTALSPPQCVTLYCVPEQRACSADEQCVEGLRCHKGRCNRCNLCGNVCEIDVSSDPENCGGCGKKVAAGQQCVDGKPVCPSDAPTLCGDACVDTRSDPRHCGGCDGPVAPAQQCIDGKAVCPGASPTLCGDACVDTRSDLRHCGGCDRPVAVGGSCSNGRTSCGGELEICGATCVDTRTDRANCGTCGKACALGIECDGGLCYRAVDSASSVQTCTMICDGAGLACEGGGVIFIAPLGGEPRFADVGCAGLPGQPPSGYVFSKTSCFCVPR